MLRPIPAQMLRDTVTVTWPLTMNAYQEATTSVTLTLKNCCVQTGVQYTRSIEGQTITFHGRTFVDQMRWLAQRGSYPVDMGAMIQGAIEGGLSPIMAYNGVAHTVLECETVRNDIGGIHHYEIGWV